VAGRSWDSAAVKYFMPSRKSKSSECLHLRGAGGWSAVGGRGWLHNECLLIILCKSRDGHGDDDGRARCWLLNFWKGILWIVLGPFAEGPKKRGGIPWEPPNAWQTYPGVGLRGVRLVATDRHFNWKGMCVCLRRRCFHGHSGWTV